MTTKSEAHLLNQYSDAPLFSIENKYKNRLDNFSKS